MTNEDWYDTEIAPALAAISQQCQQRGIAFIANVEYDQDKRGGTYFVPTDAGLAMQMLRLCANSAPNVDAYIIALLRYCREQGIDTSESVVMKRLTAQE